VTPVALERVVDRRVFRPTLRTRTSCPRGEGAVEIDPARWGSKATSTTSQGAGRPGATVNNDNGSMTKTAGVWLGGGSEPTGKKERHRVCLERAILSNKENGATHTKCKRARIFSMSPKDTPGSPIFVPALMHGRWPLPRRKYQLGAQHILHLRRRQRRTEPTVSIRRIAAQVPDPR